MDIAGLTTTGLGTSGLTSPGGSTTQTMGKEDFLKLLVAQLAHQDPMNPMDNTQFVTQLSQFTSVEQLMNINEGMNTLQLAQMSAANGQMAALIGKEVEVRADTLRHGAQGPDSVNFQLGAAAERVSVEISDTAGNLVRALDLGRRAPGINVVTWDGKDAAGNLVSAGNYRVAITAVDAHEQSVSASNSFSEVVSGLTFENGVPVLEVGQTKVQLADVLAVRQPGKGGGPP